MGSSPATGANTWVQRQPQNGAKGVRKMDKRRFATVRPKWHHQGGGVAPKLETDDAGKIIVVIRKDRKVGDHSKPWASNKPYSTQAYRAIRRKVKVSLKKQNANDDYHDDELNMANVRTEHNWRGT